MDKDFLGDLTPRTPEQKAIFDEAVKKILKKIALERKAAQQKNFVDSKGIFKINSRNAKLSDGFSKDRELRMIALIPADMAEIAKKMYGDDVLTDRKKFKEAFVKDETGRYCLTVDPKTI